MSESGKVVKWMFVFLFVIMFTVLLSDWNPSAPQLQGWDDFQNQLSSDPFSGLEPFPDLDQYAPCDMGQYRDEYGNCVWGENQTSPECGWDPFCHLGVIFSDIGKVIGWVFQWIGAIILFVANVLVYVVIAIFGTIWWFICLIIGFFGALIGMASGFTSGMPAPVATMLNVLWYGFLILVFVMIIKTIRGN